MLQEIPYETGEDGATIRKNGELMIVYCVLLLLSLLCKGLGPSQIDERRLTNNIPALFDSYFYAEISYAKELPLQFFTVQLELNDFRPVFSVITVNWSGQSQRWFGVIENSVEILNLGQLNNERRIDFLIEVFSPNLTAQSYSLIMKSVSARYSQWLTALKCLFLSFGVIMIMKEKMMIVCCLGLIPWELPFGISRYALYIGFQTIWMSILLSHTKSIRVFGCIANGIVTWQQLSHSSPELYLVSVSLQAAAFLSAYKQSWKVSAYVPFAVLPIIIGIISSWMLQDNPLVIAICFLSSMALCLVDSK